MSRTAFHRPARTRAAAVPEQRVVLSPPPQKTAENQASSWLYLLMPLLTSASMAAYMVTYGRPWMVVLGVVFVVLSVFLTFWVRFQARSAHRRARTRQRDRYGEYLAAIRAQARESAAAQRAVAAFVHPGPRRLWATAVNRRRVWERRPGDDDFLRLRLGLGRAVPALQLSSANRGDPTAEYDEQSRRAAERLVRDYATIGLQPAWIDLARCGVATLLGPPDRTRALAATLLAQLTVLHAPDDVRVAVLTAGEQPHLSWLKWTPHTRQDAPDGTASPLVSETVEGLADVLAGEVERARRTQAERSVLTARRREQPARHCVVVLDGYRPGADWARLPLVEDLLAEADPGSGLHVVCLVERENDEPGRVDARARVDASGALALESPDPALVSAVRDAVADESDARLHEQTAKALAPLHLSGEREQVLARSVELPGMLGVEDLASFDPVALWRAPDDEALLRLPVGLTGEGEPLVLDLKEAAQGGVGPHGLVVGATGSGKSELLRTLVTGLTMTHAPEQLGFVLVDFKGGATFAGVTELPHVAGLITNLADDLALVDRVRAALQGEQQRRQRMLRDAGNVDSVREYQILQAQGATDIHGRPLEPMPYLMVVVDEFGELLTRRPDFIDLFVQIGRVGRSLGMHLLLATQRLDEGRLRGLESHLSYRICLRTFSAAESRAVIGTPDAYTLPSIPGSAYLRVDESVYQRFRVAHVSAPHQEPGTDAEPVRRTAPPVLFGLRTPEDVRRAAAAREAEPAAAPVPRPLAGRRTEMQVAVERVTAFGTPVHQVWLPPLPGCVELDSLVGPVSADPGRGFRSERWPRGGRLSFPVGVVDLPERQEQRALLLDLAGAHGHLAVVGAPQSGKSTLLRTFMLSAMVTHTPRELRFLAVDFGGGTLAGLEAAPHVSGVATRHEEDRVLRTLAVARQTVEERERLFQRLQVNSSGDFRALRDAGKLPDGTDAADVVLVVDNWPALRGAVEDADRIVHDIASRGLGVGVHLVLSANRWTEIRSSLRDNITGRLELRLNEPSESEVSRKAARQLVSVLPGRGIVAPGHLFHTALPRLDGDAATEGLTKAEQSAVADLAACWTGERAPALRMLPDVLTPEDLAAAEASAADTGQPEPHPSAVPVGLRELDLLPARLDLEADDPHFVVFGDSGSGKTQFLRSWMRAMSRRRSEWDIRFVVLDYRRGLVDAVPEEYLGARAGDPDSAAAYVGQMADKLRERTPPPDVTPRQLRERSWWEGPELYLVIDDYDLVASPGTPALTAPLLPYLTQGAELGFHVVLARRTGGLARSQMSDPLLARIREYGSGGLLLSGDPREGALLGGHRAAPRVPGRGLLVGRRTEASVVQTVLETGAEAV
ncbi:type VII secretion protein EccCa [Streptomyces sp. NPDC001380]|uniref:type VII secretion protein EccCa n=1 Tax=Streptomyces sp. NPDC001380 TaxID=3364566 RepID=UPI0036764020